MEAVVLSLLPEDGRESSKMTKQELIEENDRLRDVLRQTKNLIIEFLGDEDDEANRLDGRALAGGSKP